MKVPTRFCSLTKELLDHDYSLYYTNYSKNIKTVKLKIQGYSTQIQKLKKETLLFKN